MKFPTLCLRFKIGLLLIKFSALFPKVLQVLIWTSGPAEQVRKYSFSKFFQVLPLFPSLDAIFATTFFIYMEN